MPDNKSRVLFISSIDPLTGPGAIATDYVNALRKGGYDVDLLSKYPVPGRPDILHVSEKSERRLSNLKYKLWRRIVKPDPKATHALFYRKETEPPVPIEKILSAVGREYDAIMIFFWQTLLSYATVRALYRHMAKKPKVIFLCADYSPMTGACHFMDGCRNYESGCGNCPMIRSKNKRDFTNFNMKYRMAVNSEVKPAVILNRYMRGFFEKSPAMQCGARFADGTILLDLDKFKPGDMANLRRKYSIAPENFVILFGCQSLDNPRKGILLLVKSLTLLHASLSSTERDKIQVMIVGTNAADIASIIPFESILPGYVPVDKLPELYSMADVFLSASVDDAGPSMVNQSIACGTPIVAFEIGTALDVVQGRGTGHCVATQDCKSFSEAILDIYRQTPEEKCAMRNKCRQVATEMHSPEAFLKIFNSI